MAILAECPVCHKRHSLRNKHCKCGEDLDKAKKGKRVKYWIAYRLPGGKQKFEKMTGDNSNSIEFARDADAKRKVQKREKRIFDVKLEATMTFKELSDWYLHLHHVKTKKYYPVLQIRLNRFNSEFGGKIVQDIKNSMLKEYQIKRQTEGRANSTIDQEVGAAKAVINAAFNDDKVGGDVLKQFKVKGLLQGNANRRKKTINPFEFNRLVESAPTHLEPILLTGYWTGMREGEVLNLKWKGISLKDRIIKLEAEETKNHEAREIPISDDLFKIVSGIPRPIHNPHVFLFRGKPIRFIFTAMRKASKGAGIVYGRFKDDGFIYHDLRRTFYTESRRAGVPESVIKEITGHSRNQVTDRYDDVSMDDKRKALEKLTEYRRGLVASVDQSVDREANLGK